MTSSETTINGVNFTITNVFGVTTYASEILNNYQVTFNEGTQNFTMWNHGNGKRIRIKTDGDLKTMASKTLVAQSKVRFFSLYKELS